MSEKKTEQATQMSFADLKAAKPDWQIVVQPLDNGHTKVILTKAPPKGK